MTVHASSAIWATNDVVKFFQSFLSNPDRMIVLAAVLGVLALFIITRGKWR